MYKYAPLGESNEIRLLDLQPGELHEKIHCCLRHVRLESTLGFTSLSYTWGDPNVRKTIVIEGEEVEVTRNLYDALHHLRHPKYARALWIDALSINQADLNERSKQVLRMRDIYSMAAAVEVWLGLADDHDIAAMALVRQLGDIAPDPEEPLAKGFYGEWEEKFRTKFEQATPETANALAQLFKRPWWTRIWVVQELSLARQQAAIVRCGQETVKWLDFLVTAYAVESSWFTVEAIVSSHFPDQKVDAFNNGIRMAQCRRVNRDQPPFTLLELLNQHRDCEATDPKDKVYGLLGLSGDVDAIGIKPDYALSAQEIFTRLFIQHVRATKSLDMICAIRVPRNFDGLPSWVPDWSVDQMVPGICINDRYVGGNDFPGSPIAHFQKYGASGASSPEVDFSENQMMTAGVKIGTIISLGKVDDGMTFEDVETFGRANEDGKSASDSETFNDWLNMVLDSPVWENIKDRYGADNVLDSFCRTIVGNRNNRMMKPVEDDGNEEDDGSDESEWEHGSNHNEDQGEMEATDANDGNSTPSAEDPILFSPHEMLSMTADGFRSCIQVVWGKRFAILNSGHIGVVPKHAANGDVLVVLLGCSMPIVLRPIDEPKYAVVGESYVHGAMDGEAMEDCVSEMFSLE